MVALAFAPTAQTSRAETASTPLSAAFLNAVYADWDTGLATDAAAGSGTVSARPVTSAQIGANQVNAFFRASSTLRTRPMPGERAARDQAAALEAGERLRPAGWADHPHDGSAREGREGRTAGRTMPKGLPSAGPLADIKGLT